MISRFLGGCNTCPFFVAIAIPIAQIRHSPTIKYNECDRASLLVQSIATDRYGGKFVKIWNEKLKRHFYYVHFSGFNPNLRVGQTINAGYYLGNEGNTGNSSGRHTHVHVRRPDGQKEQPLISLGKL